MGLDDAVVVGSILGDKACEIAAGWKPTRRRLFDYELDWSAPAGRRLQWKGQSLDMIDRTSRLLQINCSEGVWRICVAAAARVLKTCSTPARERALRLLERALLEHWETPVTGGAVTVTGGESGVTGPGGSAQVRAGDQVEVDGEDNVAHVHPAQRAPRVVTRWEDYETQRIRLRGDVAWLPAWYSMNSIRIAIGLAVKKLGSAKIEEAARAEVVGYMLGNNDAIATRQAAA